MEKIEGDNVCKMLGRSGDSINTIFFLFLVLIFFFS